MSQGALVAGNKESKEWTPRLPRWHETARIIAALVIVDQAASLTSIPTSEAIVVACIGALFAPVPTEKRRRRDQGESGGDAGGSP